MVKTLAQDTVEKSTKPVIIMAFASWCPHCAKMKPIFDELEEEIGQKYIFAEFDIDIAKEFTTQFNVTALPTFIFIKNKKEKARELGEMPAENLKEFIKKYLG